MNSDLLLKHFERISDGPDAIPRLREFILDLAVRGKLVEQDPKDEPAYELLKRIRDEKESLVKERKINQGKPPVPATPAELDFELKPAWQAARISQLLVELQTGPFGSSLHQSDYQTGGVPVINPASIKNERLIPIERMAVGPKTAERLATFKLRDRDIVMGRRGEMGRCAVVTKKEQGWLCGTGSLILRLPQCLFPRFLVTLIGSPIVRKYLGGSAVGATMQNLNQSILLNLVVGLPPLAEQYRIVAKVDELMAICDRLEAAQTEQENRRERLAATSLHHLNNGANVETFRGHAYFYLKLFPRLTAKPNHIRLLRQLILDLAVRGRLVQQDSREEPACALLTRLQSAIARERRDESRRVRKPLLNSNTAALNGVLFPSSWAVTNFDAVNEIVSGVAKGKDLRGLKTTSVPYLRVANVQRGFLDLGVVKEIEVVIDDVERYALRKGDVLMTEGGDWDKLGRAAIWNDEVPGCIHQNHIYRIRSTIKDQLMPSWIALFANSSLGRSYFEEASKQTTNLASINMTQLRSCPLPLPPAAEQRRIVASVDVLTGLCDRLEKQLTTTQTESRKLAEAILHDALESKPVAAPTTS